MKHILLFCFLFFTTIYRADSQTGAPLWKMLPEVPAMPKADKSGIAAVNNISLYYGIFNLKGKEPVLLLHGGFVSSDVWGFEVPLLMKTHQVIVLDSRGHGRSTMGDQPLSYELMANDVYFMPSITNHHERN